MSGTPGSDDLAELRKQLAAAQAPRLAKQQADEQAEERARLLRAIEDEPAIQDAIDKYGAVGDGIAIMRAPECTVIVKRPIQAVWRRFSNSKVVDTAVTYKLVKDCVVYPTADKIEALFDKRPAALEQLGGLVAELALVRDKELAGK